MMPVNVDDRSPIVPFTQHSRAEIYRKGRLTSEFGKTRPLTALIPVARRLSTVVIRVSQMGPSQEGWRDWSEDVGWMGQ